MKKLSFFILTIIALLFPAWVMAQYTYVPDDNFEQALIELGYDIDTILNDSVPTQAIQSVTYLGIAYYSIADLTGIEDFTALEELACYGNQLTSLDVSNNVELQELYCYYNQLTSLNVSSNAELQGLHCYGNQLADLDVSNNAKLTYLNCRDNNLTGLNLKNGNNSNMTGDYWYDGMYAYGNENLFCIEVDDSVAAASYDDWEKDWFATYTEDCDDFVAPDYPMTYVPDDNFEQALIERGYDLDTILNDSVPTQAIQSVTYLWIGCDSIADLTGIEDFTALEELYCYDNQLTTLNVSSNDSLILLYCSNNQLADLDVSNNAKLTYLNCSYNNLTGLNLKNGNNSNMTGDDWDNAMYAYGNKNLFCIEVDDTAAVKTYDDWEKDDMAVYREDCDNFFIEMTYVPDDNFEQALIELGYDLDTILNDSVPTQVIQSVTYLSITSDSIANLTGIEDFTALKILYCGCNQLTSLDVSKNAALQRLHCYYNQLTSLDVSNNVELQELYCNDNQLTSLDVSKNSALQWLDCCVNQLTSLDVSKNTALQWLDCCVNQLTSLDVSENAALQKLHCNGNQLSELNLKNGNNANMYYMSAVQNSNLYCIEVDDSIAAASYSDWNKDGIATYTEDCDGFVVPDFPMTYIPDDNFEQALIDLNYDNVLDDSIPTPTVQSITNLSVRYNSIADLTGIEDFTALERLYCYGNQLTSLDVGYNTELTYLDCKYNQLTTLNVRKNAALQWLYCYNNQLTSLDVSKNSVLQRLDCDNNQLTKLDVSKNTALRTIWCPYNNITELDVTQNSKLEYLYCYYNNITALDVSSNDSLILLHCYGNQLADLDVSNNAKLTYLNCCNNNLTGLNLKNGNNSNMTGDDRYKAMYASGNEDLFCIEVDDPEAAATYDDWYKDDTASYSANCGYNGPMTYVPDDNFEQALIDLGYDFGDLDDSVSTANIETITDLNVNYENIKDLTGIEDFTALTSLKCCDNQLESIDLSNNSSLTYLNFRHNKISDLDVSKNTLLVTLICNDNKLISIDLSKNSALKHLYCYDNQITSLDLSTNANLMLLLCNDNSLTELNIKNGNNANMSHMHANDNPDLTCIEVDDSELPAGYDEWVKDATAEYSVNCGFENNAPVADAGDDIAVAEGETVILDGTGSSDADGDSIAYKWTSPDVITLTDSIASPQFTAPAVDDTTEFTFSLVVNDGVAESSPDSVVVTVLPSSNALAAVDDIDSTTKNNSTSIFVLGNDFYSSDDTITVFVETPANGTAVVDNDSILYTPANNFIGNDTFSYSICNATLCDTAMVVVTVIDKADENHAPVITSNAITTATEDEEYAYTVIAYDEDNDELSFTLTDAPSGMTISDSVITWTPTEGILSGDVVLIVSDGLLSDTSSFTIAVTPVNDAPVITSVADTSVKKGSEYVYEVTATDAENSTLTYSISGEPEGMVISGNKITWTPADGTKTSGEVTLTVSDGELTDTEMFIVKVISGTAVYELNNTEINLYPNPVYNALTIESNREIKKVRIISMTGEAVLEQETSGTNLQVDLPFISPGTYFVNIVTDKGVTVRTILKK